MGGFHRRLPHAVSLPGDVRGVPHHNYQLPPSVRSLWSKVSRHGEMRGVKAKTLYPEWPESWPKEDTRPPNKRLWRAKSWPKKQKRAALNTTYAAMQAMIRNRTKLGEIEKSILREVLKDYQRFVPETGVRQESRALAAEPQVRIANLHQLVDNVAHAEANYSHAIQEYAKFRHDFDNASNTG